MAPGTRRSRRTPERYVDVVTCVRDRGGALMFRSESQTGVHLYYEEHGEGAPILCIHGGGSTALAWAGAVEQLAGSAA